MMNNHNQDWDTVTFKKRPPPVPGPPQLSRNGIQKIQIDNETEIFRHKKVSRELAQAIIAGRCAKKWGQADLAKNANMQKTVINDIESGRAIYDDQQVRKIAQVLGLNTKNIVKTVE